MRSDQKNVVISMYIYKPIIHLTKRIKKRNKNKNWFVIVVTNVVFYFFNFHQHQIFVCRVFFVMFFFCTFSLFRPHAQHVIYKTETTKQKKRKISSSRHQKVKNTQKNKNKKFSAIFFIWSVISSFFKNWLKISFPRKKFEFRGSLFFNKKKQDGKHRRPAISGSLILLLYINEKFVYRIIISKERAYIYIDGEERKRREIIIAAESVTNIMFRE